MTHAIAKRDCVYSELSTIARLFTLRLDSGFARVLRACLVCVGCGIYAQKREG